MASNAGNFAFLYGRLKLKRPFGFEAIWPFTKKLAVAENPHCRCGRLRGTTLLGVGEPIKSKELRGGFARGDYARFLHRCGVSFGAHISFS
jgi:hypothetical protein